MNFSTIFTTTDNSPKSLFNYVTTKNLSSLKCCLSSKQSDEINNIRDEYNNNLLHIAITVEDTSIIKYLMEKGIDKYKKNVHNLSPWDLAVRSHNQTIIQSLIDTHLSAFEEIKKELKLIRDTSEQYKLLNKQLQTSSEIMTNKYNVMYRDWNLVVAEVTILKNQNKRLRDECDTVTNENNVLKEDNKKLKTAVASLIQSKKK
ncbi:MAG: hypothetical protein Edafosvirus34_11 [Edafosvirus sp.]|uniref:Uncharacterized protein n=1 Tax=Edafosvirus sp. TaxID=2487765 RepID=A0A3G4ZXS5_9VIRU|nr:MAG: hypothetical protein Edafosvirus34_11 [Edafosvirus sp.]